MQRERLHGAWVATPTPWNVDFTIDSGAVGELVVRYAAHRLHGVYTSGTDGEMHVVDLAEFRELATAFGRSAAEVGLPAQIGCTCSHTDGVIERARIARDNGITQIQIALPSWIPLNDNEMLQFFATLQEGLPDIQFVYYNIARAGQFLSGTDYRAILKVAPNLIGSKQTGGDVSSLTDIVQQTPELDPFVVDSQILPGALFGARGFYSFVANLSPTFALRLWRCCQKGRWEEAARFRETSDAFFRTWISSCAEITASPALAKSATRAGLFSDLSLSVRAPYRAGEESHVVVLRQLIVERFLELAPSQPLEEHA